MERRTKIVATIGPACEDIATLQAMIKAGMSTARISLAHGPVEQAVDRIVRVRQAAAAEGEIVGVLIDLPGPKVRAAPFPKVASFFRRARCWIWSWHGQATQVATHALLSITSPSSKGCRPLIAWSWATAGSQWRSTASKRERAVMRVVTGGWAQGRPGVALPPGRLALSSPTDADIDAIERLSDRRRRLRGVVRAVGRRHRAGACRGAGRRDGRGQDRDAGGVSTLSTRSSRPRTR